MACVPGIALLVCVGCAATPAARFSGVDAVFDVYRVEPERWSEMHPDIRPWPR
jgi:hypothetical protein